MLEAQCIVIGPVCGCVCGSVTTITRNSVHGSSPNCVCIGKGSDHLQLIKSWPFWEGGLRRGENFCSASAQCLRLFWALFFIIIRIPCVFLIKFLFIPMQFMQSVLGWATVSPCYQPPTSTQPDHPSVCRRSEYISVSCEGNRRSGVTHWPCVTYTGSAA